MYLLVVLLVTALGGVFFFYSLKPETQVFHATVDRDCAPWDGPAFTIAVQYDATTVIYISIWKAPDIKLPSRYILTGNDGQTGYAYILPEVGPFEQLSGNVFLQSVSMDKPIEGRFSLKSEGGGQFDGRFVAEWKSEMMLCG